MSFIVHPSNWEIEHAGAIFRGQEYQATHDGQLPDSPMWRMLQFRHSLNSARFDHWHPNVALILENREPVLANFQHSHHRVHGWIGHTRGPGWPSVVRDAQLSTRHGHDWVGHMRGPALPVESFTKDQNVITPPTSDFSDWRAIEEVPPQITSQQVVPEPSAALQGLTALALTVAIFVKRHRLRRLMSRRA